MHIEFHDDIEQHHARIDADDWEDIYVVGDVHGCLDALERLLETLDPPGSDLVLFVGDLVRKGPNSSGVLQRVRETPNFRSVRGNNEQKLLEGNAELPELDDDLDYCGFGAAFWRALSAMLAP